MKDVNKIILIGRLGSDPTHKEFKSGVQVVHFPLATTRKFRTEGKTDGELTEETQWHRVVAWGRQAEICAQYLKKGHTVYVEGMLRSRKYQAKDGTTKYMVEVHAENVSFLNGVIRKEESSTELQTVY